MFVRSLCSSLLLFVSLAGLVAESPPMHMRFLPPGDDQLRQEAPEQQQLIQITEYNVVLGNQRQSNRQPILITTPTLLCLKDRPLSKGATLAQVLVQFDSEGKSLKKPVYDTGARTLMLNYPLAQYPALLNLLRNQTAYCQFLAYPNGHVWTDLYTGAVRVRWTSPRAGGKLPDLIPRRASPTPEPLRESDAQRQETDH